MSNKMIQEIEDSIINSKKQVEFWKALERLLVNKDFETVVLNGYLKDEAVRLVHLKADPGITNKSGIDEDITAIGCFAQYLRTVAFRGDQALKSIEASEEILDDLREEDL